MTGPTSSSSKARPNMVTIPRAGEIFLQGKEAKHIYIIVSGKVSLWRDGMLLTSLSTQSVLGIEGLYNRTGNYAYSCRAESLCRMAKYSINEFMDEIYQTPRLTELTFSSMARQLDFGWEKIVRSQTERETFFAGDIRTCEPGEWIIREGEESEEIFRIISTEQGLEVSKGGQVLAVLKEPGEIFGEMASLLQEKRTASVRSVGKSVLEVYPPQQLMEILADYSDLSMRIIKSLSRRLAETSQILAQSKGSGGAGPSKPDTPSGSEPSDQS